MAVERKYAELIKGIGIGWFVVGITAVIVGAIEEHAKLVQFGALHYGFGVIVLILAYICRLLERKDNN